MALITNPSIDDIHSLISTIQTQIDELPTATETPQWVPLVESFFSLRAVWLNSALIDLKAAIPAEALANGIEEMTDDQALYLMLPSQSCLTASSRAGVSQCTRFWCRFKKERSPSVKLRARSKQRLLTTAPSSASPI